jgi:hypothetical protein
VTTSFSQGQVIGDAPSEGIPIFRADGDSEQIQTLKIEGAYLVADRLQLGAGIPLVRRMRSLEAGDEHSASGLGDVSLNSTYEFMPQWIYSAWKPRGFGFIQVTTPSSPSIYDARQPYLLDARGRGFWSVAVGTAFVKSVGNWDFVASFEGHRSFSRTLTATDGGELTLIPGWGGSVSLGGGISPFGGDFRFGLAISPIYEGAITSRGSVDSRSEYQLLWNTSFQASYLISADWSSSLVYSDQTLLGPAHNVSLNRALALSLQRRWEL